MAARTGTSHDNGRITRKEFYEYMERLEDRFMARVDRLEDKVTDAHNADIERLEQRIDTDKKVVGIGSLIGSIVGATIGFIGWTR